MNDKQVIDMAQRCIEEIEQLRRVNAALAPKAEAYDLLKSVVDLIPCRNNRGEGEDIVWRLKRQIADIKAQDADSGPGAGDDAGPANSKEGERS